jgi:hypothetical protein
VVYLAIEGDVCIMNKLFGKLLVLGLLGFVVFLIHPTDSKAYTETKDGDFSIYYFDTKEELDEFKMNEAFEEASKEVDKNKSILETSLAKSSYRKYSFKSTSFSNYIYMGGSARVFNGPQFMDVEKGDRKKMEARVYDSKGNYKGKSVTSASSGWIHMRFDPLTKKGSYYKIKLVNPGSGTLKLVQGELYYY